MYSKDRLFFEAYHSVVFFKKTFSWAHRFVDFKIIKTLPDTCMYKFVDIFEIFEILLTPQTILILQHFFFFQTKHSESYSKVLLL